MHRAEDFLIAASNLPFPHLPERRTKGSEAVRHDFPSALRANPPLNQEFFTLTSADFFTTRAMPVVSESAIHDS